MHHPTRGRSRLLAPIALALLVPVLASCGDDDAGGATSEAAAETASTVCGMLRDWSNELTEHMNATSDAITTDDDPATANQVLLDGWDELIAIGEAHVDEADGLDLPDTDVRDALQDELAAGAQEAVDELNVERAKLEALPPITVDAQSGALGGAFTSLEKVDSVVEPQIGSYDDQAIRTAFADEPDCRHVIQPF